MLSTCSIYFDHAFGVNITCSTNVDYNLAFFKAFLFKDSLFRIEVSNLLQTYQLYCIFELLDVFLTALVLVKKLVAASDALGLQPFLYQVMNQRHSSFSETIHAWVLAILMFSAFSCSSLFSIKHILSPSLGLLSVPITIFHTSYFEKDHQPRAIWNMRISGYRSKHWLHSQENALN